jgi:hypothetical protein
VCSSSSPGSCSCTLTGSATPLQCGTSQCIDGVEYACGGNASVTMNGTCGADAGHPHDSGADGGSCIPLGAACTPGKFGCCYPDGGASTCASSGVCKIYCTKGTDCPSHMCAKDGTCT